MLLHKKAILCPCMQEAAVLATQGYRGDQLFTLSEKGRLSKFSYATLRLPVYYLFILFAAMLLMLLSLVEEPGVVDFCAIYESSNCSDVVKPTVRLVSEIKLLVSHLVCWH